MTIERAIELLRRAGYRVIEPSLSPALRELNRMKVRKLRARQQLEKGADLRTIAGELGVERNIVKQMLATPEGEEKLLDELVHEVPIGVEWSCGNGNAGFHEPPWAFLVEPEQAVGFASREFRATGPTASRALERALATLRATPPEVKQ